MVPWTSTFRRPEWEFHLHAMGVGVYVFCLLFRLTFILKRLDIGLLDNILYRHHIRNHDSML